MAGDDKKTDKPEELSDNDLKDVTGGGRISGDFKIKPTSIDLNVDGTLDAEGETAGARCGMAFQCDA